MHRDVIDTWAADAPHAQLWVGESAAAWHSGRDNVTNAFASCFWYSDVFGVVSKHNHTGASPTLLKYSLVAGIGFCRQTLLGGSYGLLDRLTYKPNPDFYTGLLFRRLMSGKVYNTSVAANGSAQQGTNTLRAYSHCSGDSGTLTLLLINIDKAVTFEVSASADGKNLSSLARKKYMYHHVLVTSCLMPGMSFLPTVSPPVS